MSDNHIVIFTLAFVLICLLLMSAFFLWRVTKPEHSIMSTKLDSTRDAFVDPSYYWRSMESCPIGVKVQLLNPSNSACYGKWNGKDATFKGWAPLPKIPQFMKDTNNE